MKKDFRKIYWTIVIIWAVLAALSTVAFAATNDSNPDLAKNYWNMSYWTTVIFICLNIVIALGFALAFLGKGLIDDPKKQMGILIGVGALVLVFVASFLMASGTDVPKELFEKTGSDYDNSKLIGGSLYTVYVLFGGVLLAAIYTEVAKKLK